MNPSSYSATDEREDARTTDAQVDGTDIDNPGEEYTKVPSESKESDPRESASDINNEDEDESSSSGDDTVVELADSSEENFEDTINDDIEELHTYEEGQVEEHLKEEIDAKEDEVTFVDSIEEINPVQEHPIYPTEGHPSRSEVDVLEGRSDTIEEGEDHVDDKADISQEHVQEYVQNVIEAALVRVGDEPETENLSQSDPIVRVEDDIYDGASDSPTDESQLASGDLEADEATMGEGASKLEPRNLSEHPLIPADVSDLTAGEAKGPTGDKIIIIDYKKRRQEPEADNPSSFEIREENDNIIGEQYDSLASDPSDTVEGISQGQTNEAISSAHVHQEEQFLLPDESPKSDRGDEKTPLPLSHPQDTEVVFDGSLASHPNDLPNDASQYPPSFSVADASVDYGISPKNIEYTQSPDEVSVEEDSAVVSAAGIEDESGNDSDDDFIQVVTKDDRITHEDMNADNGRTDINDHIMEPENEMLNDTEDVKKQEMVQTGDITGTTQDRGSIEPDDKEGNVLKDSVNLSEDERHNVGGETPCTNLEGDEDGPCAKFKEYSPEEQERTNKGDHLSTDERAENERESEFGKVEEKIHLPVSVSYEEATFAENIEPDDEISYGIDFQTDSHTKGDSVKFEDGCSEEDETLEFNYGDDKNLRNGENERSVGDAVVEVDEGDKADEGEDLVVLPSDDESSLTGNLECISNDLVEDEHSNDVNTAGSREGDAERKAVPDSFLEVETSETEKSETCPVDLPEERSARNELNLDDAIKVNNLYLSKSSNDAEEFPVTNLSGESEGYQGSGNNEACDTASDELEKTDEYLGADDNFPSDHITSEKNDNIESEKLAKDLEEKCIEEVPFENTEQGQYLEGSAIDAENRRKHGDESSGSESTSTTPSIDYGEYEEEDEVSQVDGNKLEPEPYVETDSDDKLVEESVIFQEDLAVESSVLENFLNKLNDVSNENSDGSAPRKTYTDEEVKKAIQILTSRPPYDDKDIDYDSFYNGMSRAETLRVFALVLAPQEHQKKERVFGIFANPDDVQYDNRLIGDFKEEKISPTLTDKKVDLSALVAGLEQPMSADVSEDVETFPKASTEESGNLFSKDDSEDDETESSSSASSGMYMVGDYVSIVEDERDPRLMMEEQKSTPNINFDDEYPVLYAQSQGGKFFCVTKRFVKPSDERDRTDQLESEPIRSFSAVPPDVERPLPTHKTPLDWIGPEDTNDARTPKTVSHSPLDREFNIETETKILHFSEDRVEYDLYLIHQPTHQDAENVDQVEGHYNVYLDHDSREDLEVGPTSNLEDAIAPTRHDTRVFQPQNMGDGEWEKVDSPEKIKDVRSFEFNPIEVKHMSFEENVLFVDQGGKGVHENDIVPEIVDPNIPINFDFCETPETHGTTAPTLLATSFRFNTEDNDRLEEQQPKDGNNDEIYTVEVGQGWQIEEGNVSDQEGVTTCNVNLDHDAGEDIEEPKLEDPTDSEAEEDIHPSDEATPVETETRIRHLSHDHVEYDMYLVHQPTEHDAAKVDEEDDSWGHLQVRPDVKHEDAIVPTTHDAVQAFRPLNMGDGEWEKVESPQKVGDMNNFDFNPPEVKHRSFEEKVLSIDQCSESVHEHDIVPEVLEPVESSQIKFPFDEPSETHVISEDPILLTTIRFKTIENIDRPDKQQLLENITDITSDGVFQLNEDAESIESDPPHFHEEEPLLKDLHANKDQTDETPASITDLLRDAGITEDNDVPLGGSAFVVVGTPSEQLPGDGNKLSEIGMNGTLPTVDNTSSAGPEKISVTCDDSQHVSFSSSSPSSSSDEKDNSEEEEIPYEVLDMDIDSSNKDGEKENVSGYLPSLTLPLEQLSSSSSTSYDDDNHVDVDFDCSDQSNSGRRSSSSSSCSSNNTAQEPEVPNRLNTDQASMNHGLADLHDMTSEEATEYCSHNTSIDETTDVTVRNITKESEDIEHSTVDVEVQAFLEKDPICEDEDHEISNETDMYNDRNNPITDGTDVTMAVYLEKIKSDDENAPPADSLYDCKLEDISSSQIPGKSPDDEQGTSSTLEDTVPPVSFNMYLDTVPLEESPVEIDRYVEHVPKQGSDREADVFSTSDSEDITPPRGRVESSSAASAFSDSDVGEEKAANRPSIIFAVYGKASETDSPDEKPMVLAIHQGRQSLYSQEMQEGDEHLYEFQGSVEVYREEEFGEIHKRSVTSFVEISRRSGQPFDRRNSAPDDAISNDSVK